VVVAFTIDHANTVLIRFSTAELQSSRPPASQRKKALKRLSGGLLNQLSTAEIAWGSIILWVACNPQDNRSPSLKKIKALIAFRANKVDFRLNIKHRNRCPLMNQSVAMLLAPTVL
jgi:hypothetical protein